MNGRVVNPVNDDIRADVNDAELGVSQIGDLRMQVAALIGAKGETTDSVLHLSSSFWDGGRDGCSVRRW